MLPSIDHLTFTLLYTVWTNNNNANSMRYNALVNTINTTYTLGRGKIRRAHAHLGTIIDLLVDQRLMTEDAQDNLSVTARGRARVQSTITFYGSHPDPTAQSAGGGKGGEPE